MCGTASAQTVGQFRYDTTKFLKVGGRNHVMIPGIQRITDSTHKPLVMGPDSVIKVGTYWPGGAGGSGSTEYVVEGYGINVDSLNRRYTVWVDTTLIQKKLTLTTGGTSGPATLNGNVLNIPEYATAGASQLFPSLTFPSNLGTISAVADDTAHYSIFNVKDFGAIGDSTTDDILAFEAAQNAMPAEGGVLFLPPGDYRLSRTFAVTKNMRIVGALKGLIYYGSGNPVLKGYGSKIFYTDDNSPAIQTTVSNYVQIAIEKVGIAYSGTTPTTGNTAISIAGSGACVIRDAGVANFYDGVRMEDENFEYTIDNLTVLDPHRYGLFLANPTNFDFGDQNISNCIFRTHVRNATSAIRFEGGGGVKITNLKVNGSVGARFVKGIDVYNTNGATVDFSVVNASIENHSGEAFSFGGTEGMDNILLSNIQIAYATVQTVPSITVATNIDFVSFTNIICSSPGTTEPVIDLINVAKGTISGIVHSGYIGDIVTQTGSTVGLYVPGTVSATQVEATNTASAVVVSKTFNNTGVSGQDAQFAGVVSSDNGTQNAIGRLKIVQPVSTTSATDFVVQLRNAAFSQLDQLTLSSTGALRLHSYGAGTLVTDASGNVTATSDINLKKDIKPSATGLKEILKLNPIVYSWNLKSGNETKGRYTGFSAQNVRDNIPNGTGVMPDGHLTLQDRAIMAAMVNAIKELEAKIEKLEKLLILKK